LSTTVTVCVEVAVLLFPSVAVQVTVFDPFTKLAGERVTVTVAIIGSALRLIENWHRYKLPSLHSPDCCQGGYSWNLIVHYSYSCVEVAVLLFPSVAVRYCVWSFHSNLLVNVLLLPL
jgi:hypothetical protein